MSDSTCRPNVGRTTWKSWAFIAWKLDFSSKYFKKSEQWKEKEWEVRGNPKRNNGRLACQQGVTTHFTSHSLSLTNGNQEGWDSLQLTLAMRMTSIGWWKICQWNLYNQLNTFIIQFDARISHRTLSYTGLVGFECCLTTKEIWWLSEWLLSLFMIRREAWIVH